MSSPQMILDGTLLIDYDDPVNFNMVTLGGTPIVAIDSVNTLEATSAIKVTCDSGDYQTIRLAGLTLDLTNANAITVWYYAHNNMPAESNMVLDLITDAGGKANFFTYSQQSATAVLFNTQIGKGWNAWTISMDDLTAIAAADLADIRQIWLRAIGGANTLTWSIDSIYIHTYAKPKLCFVFDDINASDKSEAYDYMQPLGIAGSSSLYSTGMESGARLALADAKTMKENGWCFINHSDDPTLFEAVTTAEALSTLQTCKDYIKNNGLEINGSASMVVYPGGRYTSDLIDALPLSGFTFGRIATEKDVPNQFITHPKDSTAQSINKFLCSLSMDLDAAFTIAAFRTQMEDLTKYGGVGFLMIHGIVASGATGIQIDRADFRAAVDYAILLEQRGLIDIVTVEEAINGNP